MDVPDSPFVATTVCGGSGCALEIESEEQLAQVIQAKAQQCMLPKVVQPPVGQRLGEHPPLDQQLSTCSRVPGVVQAGSVSVAASPAPSFVSVAAPVVAPAVPAGYTAALRLPSEAELESFYAALHHRLLPLSWLALSTACRNLGLVPTGRKVVLASRLVAHWREDLRRFGRPSIPRATLV